MHTLTVFFQNFNVAFTKVIARSIVHYIAIIEKIRKIGDFKGAFAAVLTDLSKAFDYISHKFLLANFYA